jgi:hypothetical protein
MSRKLYEPDDETFSADAYTVRGWPGVAVDVLGWELEPVAVILCPDCAFHAIERPAGGGKILDRGDSECEHLDAYQCEEPDHERTGRVIVVMIGDDAHHAVDADDLAPLSREDYCGECGQVGCHCDAYAA